MKRLAALDVMRGLTIALMILVNTALWGTPVFGQLQHSLWNGLTAADVVFPMFMFIMGVSMAFSLKKYAFHPGNAVVKKIIRRTLLIYLIGTMLDLIEKGISGVMQGLDFSMLRFTGVLPRLAFSYGFAAFFALCFKRKTLAYMITGCLVIYAAILIFAKGYVPAVENIIVRVDLAVFGENHIYHDWVPGGGRIPLDPEGLLGLLPSIAHVLIGYLCGRLLQDNGKNNLTPLLLAGAALTLGGLALDAGIPINKKVWSPTFVMVSCGFGALLLGLLIYAIDIKGKRWFHPFEIFGANPLFLYVFSSVIGCVLWRIDISGIDLPRYLYDTCLLPLFGPQSAWPSLIYSLAVTMICYMVGLFLHRKKIYIKI